MRNLGPVEAAKEIAHDVANVPGLDPEEQHHVRFVKSVCTELGMDHSPESMHKVAVVLHQHGIAMHQGHEFPKYAARDYDGARKIVNDEQEEKEWVEEAQPEPFPPVGRIIEDTPPHQQGLDLTKQVPHAPKTVEHPAGRAPDEQTNRSARQVETLDSTAAHDDHGDTDGGDGPEEFSDDDVHVEDIDPAAPGSAAEAIEDEAPKPKSKRPM